MSKAMVLIALAMLIACCHAARVNRKVERSALNEVNRSSEESVEEHSSEDSADDESDEDSEAEDYSDEEEGMDEEGDPKMKDVKKHVGCKNYCVQCNDGSTVWYGRGKNWWKMGASGVLGSVGAVATGSGIGLLGGAVGAAATGVLAYTEYTEADEAKKNHGDGKITQTHWSGSVPTGGWFCEKVDVLKFSKNQNCQTLPFMERSENKFGRLKNNFLKPYDEHSKLKYGFQQSDMGVYKDGCKVVKAAGTKAFSQLIGQFGKFCKRATTKGIQKCSAHSKLCGAAGVAGTNHAKSADQCMQQCQKSGTANEGKLKCPNEANPQQQSNGYSNQQSQDPYGQQNQQQYAAQQPYGNQQQQPGYTNQPY